MVHPSSSPFFLLILLVQKKDSSYRMCVDSISLKNHTNKNVTLIPRIEGILDKLQGSCCLSRIDLKSGYYQTRIMLVGIHKMVFCPTFGLSKFLVMPFNKCPYHIQSNDRQDSLVSLLFHRSVLWLNPSIFKNVWGGQGEP